MLRLERLVIACYNILKDFEFLLEDFFKDYIIACSSLYCELIHGCNKEEKHPPPSQEVGLLHNVKMNLEHDGSKA